MAGQISEFTQPRARGGIITALNREWEMLDDRHQDVVAAWSARYLVFRRCRCFAEVLEVVRAHPDDGLHALLTEVANGQPVAGRVVLQSLVGRLVQMARRDVRVGVDDYVSALWCEIGAYPLAQRPSRIAANLTLDTLQSVRREHRWVVRGEVATWPPGELLDEIFHGAGAITDHHPRDSLAAAGVLAAARQLQVIDASTQALLTSVYLDGLTGLEASRRHRTTPGSVRVRCSRAVGRMRQAAPELVEVA